MVFQSIESCGHEQVLFHHDRVTGLRAIIALHSTVRGPGLGGVRIRRYSDESEALADVLDLSKAMSYKAACAGLDFGGGKAVVLAPLPADRVAGMHAVAEAIASLDGRYVATEDMGMSEADIACLNERTRFAVGRARNAGGSGDPSPYTADGVLAGIRATAMAAGLSADLSGMSVAVQGCGNVGLSLIERLLAAGARVLAADPEVAAAERARAAGANIIDNSVILQQSVDVVAPCGAGGVLDECAVDALNCRVVAGAANNPLTDANLATTLAERGIFYAPDFVINAGGLINVADELAPTGYSSTRVQRRVANIGDTLTDIFAEARHTQATPLAVALDRAQARITDAAGAGRQFESDAMR
ncbi:Glu/Leu/Phe/Val dehydrogenase [Salinisphaera sp. USBA-960]|uniref:Glu/Leu/Phe/Val dehydrogenase family protein n=1 Tax=Salinisphaera orenii TaxID=856731 RepID=UPI000DBE3B8B|nr:Glu/Leu/Phe/Val dehydrogenase [Salifodinibacter halophilus]NNC25613.1 Glu/Leu/Phe/Val dehydrogenase [Salifodinibacter halophilus]